MIHAHLVVGGKIFRANLQLSPKTFNSNSEEST